MCHCDDCRLTTGMLANDFVCLDGIIKEDLFDPSTPQGLPPGLVGYTPTRVTWYFCAMCGAHLLQSYPRAATGKDDKTHHQWFLSPGTLYPVSVPAITAIAEEGGLGREKAAAAAAAVPEEHIMVFKRNKHIWVRPKRDQGGLAKFLAHDGLPRYKSQHCEKPDQRLAPGQTECDGDEDRGRAVELAIHMAASAPTLPLRCRCGHVRLTLQRPEARPVASKWQTTASSDGKRWVWGFCVCNACRATSGYEHSAFLFCPYSHLDRNGSGSGSGSGDDWAIAAGPAMQTQTQIEGTSTALSPMSSTHPGAKDLVGDPRYPATAGLRDYRSNADGHRRFCPYCGAIVLLDYDDRGELVDVYLGAVDAPVRGCGEYRGGRAATAAAEEPKASCSATTAVPHC